MYQPKTTSLEAETPQPEDTKSQKSERTIPTTPKIPEGMDARQKKKKSKGNDEKKNASERINLQHIMELREQFEKADEDDGESLDQKEFIASFGGILGKKEMSVKELDQLFMRIDADANGSVEWHEFMNYMLLENITLSAMKEEHFNYEQHKNDRVDDPPPHKKEYCHMKNITSILVLYPEMLKDIGEVSVTKQTSKAKKPTKVRSDDSDSDETSSQEEEEEQAPKEYIKQIKYVTGSTDGHMKIWKDGGDGKPKKCDQDIEVSKWYVMAITFMTLSKRLVAASADRMISFYKTQNGKKFDVVPVSRIENMYAVPHCLEYYEVPKSVEDTQKKGTGDVEEKALEILLVGDDLGICQLIKFTKLDWHFCSYNAHLKAKVMKCHQNELTAKFNEKLSAELTLQKKMKEARIAEASQRALKKGGDVGEEDKQKNKKSSLVKRPNVVFDDHVDGVIIRMKQIHKGWITKIKYYPDLNYVVSSSLDGFIHIHDIQDLNYKENKTFNLHQKGINSFVYSYKHRFIASCGEERSIIMWDPFTLGTLSYLSKHNTSVQDLAINEQKNHLISLGTDKEVIIWDIKTYVDIQRIKNDIIPVRPEDILSGLFYCKKSRDIILGSRRIQFWHFKTQEQIKTSHEGDVGFAIYNSHFESVVSGDDEGYVALWDIENGKLMSRFGEAHGTDPQGKKRKVTCGTFDVNARRLVTAGEDGSVKIWNFSNGHALKNLVTEPLKDKSIKAKPPTQAVPSKKPRREFTALLTVTQKPKKDKDRKTKEEKKEEEEDEVKRNKDLISHFVAVGWDRKLHIWDDNRESADETVVEHQTKSEKTQDGHHDDIMSACYDQTSNLIFTGGHDGTLLGWNFETRFIKTYMHEIDRTCVSEDYIRQSKSVDCLTIMEKQRILLSGTADQCIRFWDLKDITANKPPLFKFQNFLDKDESLSAFAVDSENEILLTADTAGRFKKFDIKGINWHCGSEKEIASKIRLLWYVQAHKQTVKTLQIVENFKKETNGEIFVVSAGADMNILLHRLKNGAKIGQFSQEATWKLKDPSTYIHKRPNYVREWFKKKKEALREFIKDIAKTKTGKNISGEEVLKVMQAATVEKQEEMGFKSDSFEKHGYHEENINLALFDDYNEDKSDDDDTRDDYEGEFNGVVLNNAFNQPTKKAKKSKVNSYERTNFNRKKISQEEEENREQQLFKRIAPKYLEKSERQAKQGEFKHTFNNAMTTFKNKTSELFAEP